MSSERQQQTLRKGAILLLVVCRAVLHRQAEQLAVLAGVTAVLDGATMNQMIVEGVPYC